MLRNDASTLIPIIMRACQGMEEIRGHSPIDSSAQLALCKRVTLIIVRIVSSEKKREEKLLVNIKPSILTIG